MSTRTLRRPAFVPRRTTAFTRKAVLKTASRYYQQKPPPASTVRELTAYAFEDDHGSWIVDDMDLGYARLRIDRAFGRALLRAYAVELLLVVFGACVFASWLWCYPPLVPVIVATAMVMAPQVVRLLIITPSVFIRFCCCCCPRSWRESRTIDPLFRMYGSRSPPHWFRRPGMLIKDPVLCGWMVTSSLTGIIAFSFAVWIVPVSFIVVMNDLLQLIFDGWDTFHEAHDTVCLASDAPIRLASAVYFVSLAWEGLDAASRLYIKGIREPFDDELAHARRVDPSQLEV